MRLAVFIFSLFCFSTSQYWKYLVSLSDVKEVVTVENIVSRCPVIPSPMRTDRLGRTCHRDSARWVADVALVWTGPQISATTVATDSWTRPSAPSSTKATTGRRLRPLRLALIAPYCCWLRARCHGWVDHTKYLWFRDEGWRAGAGSVTAGPLAWCVSLSWSIPSSRLPPTFDQLEVLILVDCSVNLVIPGRALHAKIPYLSIDCQLSTPPDSVLPAMRVDVFLWSYPSAQRAPELHRIAEGSWWCETHHETDSGSRKVCSSDGLTGCIFVWSINWLIDRMVDWLIVYMQCRQRQKQLSICETFFLLFSRMEADCKGQ